MQLDPTSDRALWDSAAREFAPLRPILHRFLMARVRDHHVAEDLTQETLLRGVLHARQLRAPGAALGWLLRIAWHVALDWHRRRIRRREAWRAACMTASRLHEEPAACVAEVADEGELEWQAAQERTASWRRTLRQALLHLEPLDRVLLIGYHFSGLSCRELADRCGRSRDTVKQRLCRARRRLRPFVDLDSLTAPAEPARRASA